MRTARMAMLTAPVLLALLASACTSGPNQADVTTTVPTTTAPTTTAPTTTAPTTTAPSTTAPTTTAPSTTAPSTTQPCSTAQLSVTLGKGNGTAGSVYVPLQFRNNGSSACTLYGYPGVSYVTGATGQQVGSAAERTAPVAGETVEQVVTLAPGSVAQATLQEIDVGNFPASTCSPVAVRGLRVYPPGQTAAAFIPAATRGCTQSGPVQLRVGFVVQAPAGSP